MDEYKILNNYLLLKELHADLSGINYRGGEIKGDNISEHKLITEVHSFLTSDENTWKRVTLLLEGIKKSNIPPLYSPDKIIKSKEATLLVFPYLKGRTLETILEDSETTNIPINFDLAFSIVYAIADIIDIGSSIVVSGKKSFHGFLTPDNIIVDYDGNIFLKNYGIAPYLNKTDAIFNEIEMKYGAWLPPEFHKKEDILPQSDIYHLGYIVYKILTGNYYSFSPGENFETKFSSISLSHIMPTIEKDYLTNLINFFKKTLNPDSRKRFADVKELKDYISNYFRIEELSSVTFSMAYFMNSLYAEVIEKEEEVLKEELAYKVPPPKEFDKKAKAKADSEIVEKILTGLDEQKRTRSRLMVPLIIILVIVSAVGAFLYFDQSRKAEQERIRAEQELIRAQEEKKRQDERLAQMEREFQARLKAIQEQTASTEVEQKAKEEEIKKLREWRQQQEQAELEKIKAAEAKKLEEEAEEQKRLEIEAEKNRKVEEERKKREEAERKLKEEQERVVKPGEQIDIKFATQKPVLIKEEEPDFSRAIRKKYKGRQVKITASLLVDENGNVSRVRIRGNVEPELKLPLSTAMANWKYKSAEKNGVKVKVWWDVVKTLAF